MATANVKMEKRGNKAVMVIEIEMQSPTPSASGKTLVVATTNGNQATTSTVKHNGEDMQVIVGLNAYIKP